ncbi:ABC transporter substrate-binding protein [Lacrimispora sp.]|uniref:ABC transporter substrate-binding protein n=1 Tax=Lacrimispora sp. TaxID=2719234 RepID=UPI00289CE20B|nr:ABC transporter substrate-binding protein [Lacrimispora sp.]
MKKAMAIMFAGLMTFNLAACGSSQVPSTTAANAASTGTETKAGGTEADGEILIGCLQDITGATSSLGQMVEAGAQWAVDEINENGGVNGKKLVMNTYDTKADVTEAINAYTKAVTSDKVSIIVGPPVANIALAIKETSEQYEVPVMGLAMDPSAQLKADGTPYKNMFCFQPNAIQQGAIMAKYAMKNGFKTFGVIYNESNAYSLSLKDPFITTITENGGTVDEKQQVAYNANDTDFKTLLSPIVNANVDAIYAPNYTKDLVNIVTAARALGYEGAIICGLDACPPFNTMLGGSSDGVYCINNVDDTEPELQKMIAAVKEKTGVEATNKFFLGYDIVKVAVKCLEETGTDDPAALRTAIENVKDFNGLTGNISIDPKTHMTTGLDMVMFTYEGTTPKMLERFSADN